VLYRQSDTGDFLSHSLPLLLPVLQSPSERSSAGKVTTGLAESNGSLLPGDDLKVTCGLIACTLGSAPCPTLSNE